MTVLVAFNRPSAALLRKVKREHGGGGTIIQCDSPEDLMAVEGDFFRYFVIGDKAGITPEEFGAFVEKRLAPRTQGSEAIDDVTIYGSSSSIVRRFRTAALKKNRRRR